MTEGKEPWTQSPAGSARGVQNLSPRALLSSSANPFFPLLPPRHEPCTSQLLTSSSFSHISPALTLAPNQIHHLLYSSCVRKEGGEESGT